MVGNIAFPTENLPACSGGPLLVLVHLWSPSLRTILAFSTLVLLTGWLPLWWDPRVLSVLGKACKMFSGSKAEHPHCRTSTGETSFANMGTVHSKTSGSCSYLHNARFFFLTPDPLSPSVGDDKERVDKGRLHLASDGGGT